MSSSGSPASNQGSPFLGVQAHKFMGSPSLALTGHMGGQRDGGMKFMGSNSNNNNNNKSQASPAQHQQKLQRLPSFPNSFAPAVVQQQQQQQQHQQMGMHGGGAYGNYQQQKPSPTHAISPTHTLYAQNPHVHQQYAQQGGNSSQQQGGGGGYHQQGPLSPNNQFSRPFREGDLNQQAGVYGGNNNPQGGGGGGPVKRHSFQGPSSEGGYYQQANYYNEILSGGSNNNNNNPSGGLEGGGLSTGPIGRRPSHPGASSSNHLLGGLRISDLPPSPPKEDQRLGAGPSPLYALGGGDAHSSGDSNNSSSASAYSAFQQYRANPSLSAPLAYQPQSPHLGNGGGSHLASPSSQAAQLQGNSGAQGLAFQGFSSSEDTASPRNDSYLRDFSKDFSKF